MTLGEIAIKARDLVGANSASWSDPKLLVDINIWLQRVKGWIQEAQDESDAADARNTSTFPIITTPLTTNRDYGFSQSNRINKIKTVSISYDGVNFYKATPIDSSEILVGLAPSDETAAEASIDGLFSKTSPRYDIKYNSVFIYPKATQADVDAGGEIMIETLEDFTPFTLAELQAGTVEPGFDVEHHPILCYGPALEKTIPNSKANKTDIKEMLGDLKAGLDKAYGKKVLDRDLVFKGINNNFK